MGIAHSADDNEIERTISSQLFDNSIQLTMVVSISDDDLLETVTVNLLNVSNDTYRLGLPKNEVPLTWGLFITTLEDQSQLINKDDLVMDFDSHYVAQDLPPGDTLEWIINIKEVVDDTALHELTPAADLQVNLRIWLFEVENGEEFSYANSSMQSARLLWSGSSI